MCLNVVMNELGDVTVYFLFYHIHLWCVEFWLRSKSNPPEAQKLCCAALMAAEVGLSNAGSGSVKSLICLSFTAEVQISSSRDFIPPELRTDRRRLKWGIFSGMRKAVHSYDSGRTNGEINGFDLKLSLHHDSFILQKEIVFSDFVLAVVIC